MFHVILCRLLAEYANASTAEEEFNAYYERYLQSWFKMLVPICREFTLNEKKRKGYILDVIDLKCIDFLPAFTNNGLCLTRNADAIDKVFKPNKHLQSFKQVFLSGRDEHNGTKVRKSGSGYKYAFVIDGNRYKDLKRGLDWNKTTEAVMKVSVHKSDKYIYIYIYIYI